MTAAFLTGCPIDARLKTYDRLQEALDAQFRTGSGQGWTIDRDHWTRSSYRSGGGFSSLLPLVLARRTGDEALNRFTVMLASRPVAERDLLARRAPGWTLTPCSVRIDVYDLGMAVMNGTFEVEAPRGVTLQGAARALKQVVWLQPDDETETVTSVAAAFAELAIETTEQIRAATASAVPDLIHPPWLEPYLLAREAGGEHVKPEWGRLLWMHPVLVHDIDEPAAAHAADAMAPPFHQRMNVPDGKFVSGIGWSAIAQRPGSAAADIPLRLIEWQWAYIALYMEIDRGLLALLDDDRWHGPEALKTLEADADLVFAGAMRVVEAQARMESALASLGGDEQGVWDIIADVTKFQALVDGVDRKVDALQRIADRRVQQSSAAQARRTSTILSFLTALTIVTVAVALLGNFLGSRSDTLGHMWLRIAIVAVAILASIALYFEAHRDRLKRRDRRTLGRLDP
jgi:hypothetical protein